MLTPIAESMGMTPLVVDDELDVGVHSDIRPLLEEQLAEQRKTNSLLSSLLQSQAALIEALSDDDQDDDQQEPDTYIDGTPCR